MPLTRMIDGQPGMLVSPRCRMLRRGMGGGYHYRQVIQEDATAAAVFGDRPVKNAPSHPCEAAQYPLLGAGEGRGLLRAKKRMAGRAGYAPSDYDILG